MGKKKSERKAQAVTVAPVPGFFGYVVKPGHPVKWPNDIEDYCMQLNSAALGADAIKGRSTLSVVAKTLKIAMCTLTTEVADQWNLTQTFTPADGAVEFVVDGPNAIHLTGFIEVKDDEDRGDENDYDDFEDEEDEMMVFGGDENDAEIDIEEDLDAENDRFEVLEERLHIDTENEKKEVEKEAKKEIKPKSKKVSKKDNTEDVKEKKAGEKATTAVAGTGEQPKEDTQAAKQESKAANKVEMEKKIADKIAEMTASNPKRKKRTAPVESVEVPKKAKIATRVHKGVTIEDIAVGKGRPVQRGRKVSILYCGRLKNGKQFDANQSRKKPFTFRLGIGDVIKGMDIGIEGMRVGSKRTISIPSQLGYGREGMPPAIPSNADLIFDIEVVNA